AAAGGFFFFFSYSLPPFATFVNLQNSFLVWTLPRHQSWASFTTAGIWAKFQETYSSVF
ncbi:Hypothetical predicted protein, partial [Olea europaea subsp. europaea]